MRSHLQVVTSQDGTVDVTKNVKKKAAEVWEIWEDIPAFMREKVLRQIDDALQEYLSTGELDVFGSGRKSW